MIRIRRASIALALALGCGAPSSPTDAGLDAMAGLDAPADTTPDCGIVLAVDAPLGTMRCGALVCGPGEACCGGERVGDCPATRCLPRASSYPTECAYVGECTAEDGAACGASEGCCVTATGARCLPLDGACTGAWACITGAGGARCPGGHACMEVGLEGGTACVPVDAGADGGPDAP